MFSGGESDGCGLGAAFHFLSKPQRFPKFYSHSCFPLCSLSPNPGHHGGCGGEQAAAALGFSRSGPPPAGDRCPGAHSVTQDSATHGVNSVLTAGSPPSGGQKKTVETAAVAPRSPSCTPGGWRPCLSLGTSLPGTGGSFPAPSGCSPSHERCMMPAFLSREHGSLETRPLACWKLGRPSSQTSEPWVFLGVAASSGGWRSQGGTWLVRLTPSHSLWGAPGKPELQANGFCGHLSSE